MIKIATDCSGIEAPIEALKQLGIPYAQIFRSDIYEPANEFCKINYPEPLFNFTDLTKRNHSELSGLDVDLYVAGFPCQSYSSLGKRFGTKDPRAGVLSHIVETIYHLKPKNFILENVPRFKTIEDGNPFNDLIETLQEMGYSVSYKIMNTIDYNLPQSRKRLYIIGQISQLEEFIWPEKVELKIKIRDLIQWDITGTREIPPTKDDYKWDAKKELVNKTVLIRAEGFPTRSRIFEDRSPCLTRRPHYLYNLKRYLTGREMMSIQGFGTYEFTGETKIRNLSGNSMSINVLKLLINGLIKK